MASTKDFITKAAQSDMFEIGSSRLIVKTNGADAATKTFAQHMIDDHSRTSAELKQQLQSMKAVSQLPLQYRSRNRRCSKS